MGAPLGDFEEDAVKLPGRRSVDSPGTPDGHGRAQVVGVALVFLFFPLAAVAQGPSPFVHSILSVGGIGGQELRHRSHGFSYVAMPNIGVGKFVSRRIEVGLDLHPWIYIRQPVGGDGSGGYEGVSAFAVDLYGRVYPGPYSWKYRPYIEVAEGPFYALQPVPAAGSRFNFLTQFGAGVSVALDGLDPWSLVVGYRWMHISNAGTTKSNPGWSFSSVVIGLRKFVGDQYRRR